MKKKKKSEKQLTIRILSNIIVVYGYIYIFNSNLISSMKPLRIVSIEYYFAIICSNFNKNEIMAEKWTDSQQAKFLKMQKSEMS